MRRYISFLFIFIFLSFSGCGAEVSVSEPDTTVMNVTSDVVIPDETDIVTSVEDVEVDSKEKWEVDGVLRILTIGNSFSDDTMQYVYDIATDLGIESISLGNLFIGGCSLNTHAVNAREDKAAYEYRTNTKGEWSTIKEYKMSDAIKSQNWDFISLQQASGSSGVESTYTQLNYLIRYVKSLCPDAELVWNMTWAYQQNSTHSSFPKYGNDQLKMYNSILAAVASRIKTNSDISLIVPNGTAIQNARTSYIGDRLTRDGYHLSYDLGRYIAGLTFVSELTGRSVENVKFAPPSVDADKQKIAIEAAVNAIKFPDTITKSIYNTEPEFDASNFEKLEFTWTPHGYWYSSSAANHHKIVTTASNSNKFYASPMFTRDELPVGSVIILADGWQYRPEAWRSSGVQSSRPAITTDKRIEVTEAWWGDYTHRAFNLAKIGTPALKGDMKEIENVFTILVPKK